MRKKIYGMSIMFFLFDQLTKWIVVNQLPYGVPHSIIPSFFSLTYVKNTGGAFSIFQDHVTLLACLGIFFLYRRVKFLLGKKLLPLLAFWEESLETWQIAFFEGALSIFLTLLFLDIRILFLMQQIFAWCQEFCSFFGKK